MIPIATNDFLILYRPVFVCRSEMGFGKLIVRLNVPLSIRARRSQVALQVHMSLALLHQPCKSAIITVVVQHRT